MENQQWEETYQLLSPFRKWQEISADALLILPSDAYEDTACISHSTTALPRCKNRKEKAQCQKEMRTVLLKWMWDIIPILHPKCFFSHLWRCDSCFNSRLFPLADSSLHTCGWFHKYSLHLTETMKSGASPQLISVSWWVSGIGFDSWPTNSSKTRKKKVLILFLFLLIVKTLKWLSFMTCAHNQCWTCLNDDSLAGLIFILVPPTVGNIFLASDSEGSFCHFSKIASLTP